VTLEKRLREMVGRGAKNAKTADHMGFGVDVARIAYRAGQRDERARCVAVLRSQMAIETDAIARRALSTCAERIEKGRR